MQSKFDSWKTPRWVKDNLSRVERSFLKEMKENESIVYMWEDKGPSFTKMTRDQYLEAGRKELQNGDFYQEVANDPSNDIKKSN